MKPFDAFAIYDKNGDFAAFEKSENTANGLAAVWNNNRLTANLKPYTVVPVTVTPKDAP